MKSCFYQYRKGLYEALGLLGYSVYRHVPADVSPPYIYIGDMNASPTEDNTVYSQEVTTEIHVVTEYFGDQADYTDADQMSDEVMQLLISKGRTDFERASAIDMDDFEMTPNQLISLSEQFTFDDVNKEVRQIITMVALIDQKQDVS